jgi:hypothetical protein
MLIKQNAVPLIVGLSLGFPIFFTKNLSVFRGGVEDPEFSLPLSLFVFAVIALVASKSVLTSVLYGRYHLYAPIVSVLYFYVFALSLVLGAGDVLLLLLYFAPMLIGLMVAKYFVNKKLDHIFAFKCFALTAATFAFLHVLSSFLEFGVVGSFAVRGADSVFGTFSIYQKLIYYSTVLSLASIASLYLFNGLVKWSMFFVLFIDILMCGAREAIIIALAAFFFAGSNSINEFLKRFYLAFLGFVLLVYVVFVFFEISINDLVFLHKFTDMFSGGDVGKLTGGRSDALDVVLVEFELGWQLFLFGSGFVTSIADAMTPHNQYIEWYLRGGIVFVLVNLILIAYAITRGSMLDKFKCERFILLMVLIVSNNVNTPFRAPYASILLWYIIGVVLLSRSKK